MVLGGEGKTLTPDVGVRRARMGPRSGMPTAYSSVGTLPVGQGWGLLGGAGNDIGFVDGGSDNENEPHIRTGNESEDLPKIEDDVEIDNEDGNMESHPNETGPKWEFRDETWGGF